MNAEEVLKAIDRVEEIAVQLATLSGGRTPIADYADPSIAEPLLVEAQELADEANIHFPKFHIIAQLYWPAFQKEAERQSTLRELRHEQV